MIPHRRNFWFYLGHLGLIAVLLTVSTHCSKKKKRAGFGGGQDDQDQETPAGDPKEQTIDPEDVDVLETDNNELVRTLKFPADGDLDETGRYRTEYLLVVRALEKSCIRLKVRPASDSAPVELPNGGDVAEGSAACGEPKTFDTTQLGKAPSAEPTPGTSLTGDTGFGLTQFGVGLVGQKGYDLAARQLCSTRLFRMPASAGLGKVSTKTARLMALKDVPIAGQTRTVRVWVDEEIGQLCYNGPVDRMPRAGFAYLHNFGWEGHFDRFYRQHASSVADHVGVAWRTLAEQFGETSDVDKNQGIDVFVSPDVNRQYMYPLNTGSPDLFIPKVQYHPEDLAAYHAASNPTSNEGEIVYLWAPDPGGIYKQGLFPSSNSLSSNFAKGYAGTQIMSLISLNHHLLRRTTRPEEPWLMEALALLGGSYVGGNAYPFHFLAEFLSSRPHQLSLTEPLDASMFGEDYLSYAQYEQVGLRGMFGWYLHSKLCGPAAGPCAKIKDLLDTDLVGTANIEKTLGISFAKTMENFGLSVSLELVENDRFAKRYWDVPDDTLPLKYVEFPKLHDVNAAGTNSVLQRFEVNNEGCSAAEEQANRCTRTIAESAVAGPFVSRDMLLVQPIFPDNDMDLRLEKNSVTFIQLAGLIDKTTEVAAVLGKKLNVVFIPLGPRSDSKTATSGVRRNRFIYTEKVSEGAHMDVRPVNLTTRDPQDWLVEIPTFDDTSFRHRTKTYYTPREFPVDLNVTRDRELWVLGSIDNFDINVNGTSRTIGDTDTYNIEVEPCVQAPCASRYEVIIQLHARDFDKELAPMFLVGPDDLRYYRGAMGVARAEVYAPELTTTEDVENFHVLLCTADANDPTRCATFGVPNTSLIDDRHFVDQGAYAATFDNFLFSAPLGFPFFTHNNIQMVDNEGRSIERKGYRHFFAEEANRQFYNFDYIRDLRPNTYAFLPTDTSFLFSPLDPVQFTRNLLTSETVAQLATVKSYMNSLAGPADPAADAPGFEAYATACQALLPNSTVLCERPYTRRVDLNAAFRRFVTIPQKYFSCSDCTNAEYVVNDQGTGNTTGWPLIYLQMGSNLASQQWTTFYSPITPDSANPVCRGAPHTEPFYGRQCRLLTDNKSSTIREGDIRAQLPVSISEFSYGGCFLSVPCTQKPADVKFTGDFLAFRAAIPDESGYNTITSIRQNLTGEQARWREPSTKLSSQAGEIPGKEDRTHFVRFEIGPNIPGNPDTNTVLPILVGGRAQSQGKYLLRVRIKEFGNTVAPSGI